MHEISFLEAAIFDIENARDWYDEHQPNLGEEFILEIENGLHYIKKTPLGYPIIYYPLRMKLLTRFPFSLLYPIESENLIRIHACLHRIQNIKSIIFKRE